MCPFCIGTALSVAAWLAAGAATTGVSAIAINKLRNKQSEQGAHHAD